ncbi:MAG: nitrite reductase small subunit NirD [Acidothermus sp.]|nr:nitrite reductase small subunit NirD [Acidothermus sp.]MCL6537028.1 nitrite reductase small subunit NirD [Acidothermus sp.]
MWHRVCRVSELVPGRPVAAWLDGVQVAVVRLPDGSVHAVDNRDPFCDAMVLARGLTGSRGGADVLISPMYKHAFDLRTGRCLDDASRSITVHSVRIIDDVVYVRLAGAAVR